MLTFDCEYCGVPVQPGESLCLVEAHPSLRNLRTVTFAHRRCAEEALELERKHDAEFRGWLDMTGGFLVRTIRSVVEIPC